MSEFEQPVEPMSRVEDILRGDTSGRPMSRVEDLLKQLIEEGTGSDVTVSPALTEGVRLATINVDGTDYYIYAPEDVVGSIVTVTTEYQSGTLLATITVNDIPHYVYMPAFPSVPDDLSDLTDTDISSPTDGQVLTYDDATDKWVNADPSGGSGGGNLYGTTNPASSLGDNGDIYMKYTGGGEPVIDPDYTDNIWTGRITSDDTTPQEVTGLDISEYAYLKIHFSDTMDNVASDVPVSEIGIVNSGEPYVPSVGYYGCYLYKSADGTKLYYCSKSSNRSVLTSIDGRKQTLYPPKINKVFGKIEDEWLDFPEEGYSETVLWSGTETINAWANPYTIAMSAESMLNTYDELIFVSTAYTTSASDEYFRTTPVKTSIIKDYAGKWLLNPAVADSNHAINVYYDTTSDRIKLYATTNYGYAFLKLIGIKYGSGGSSSNQHIYSTTEQVVGKWIDGSDIYEKIIDFGNDRNFNTGWQNVEEHNDAYSLVFGGMLINTGGKSYQVDMSCDDTTYLKAYIANSMNARYLIFRYTKSST